MASIYTGLPQLVITDQEAQILGKGISDVSRQYDFGLTPKQQAWGALFMACAMVYGPRVGSIATTLKQRTRSKAKPSQTVETGDNETDMDMAFMQNVPVDTGVN